jgi:anti-sigma regulatory factor (Ser/Thr protein kinase)
MEFVFSLTLPRESSSIPAARRILGSTMTNLGIEPNCVHDVELVVTEACTNVLKHADGVGDDYAVEIVLTPDMAEIKIQDRGVGFDEVSLSDAKALDPTEESGRGIFLMRSLVDSVEFLSEPLSGTIVHLKKSLVLTEGSLLEQLDTSRSARVHKLTGARFTAILG